MNTETQVPTVEETQNQTTEATKPEVVTPEAPDDAGDEAKSEEVLDPKVLEAKLKELQRALKKAERNNSKLHQKLESINQPAPSQEPQTPEEVRQLAKFIAAQEVFAETAREIVEEGKSQNKNFDEVIKVVGAEVGGLVDQNQLPTPFMKVAMGVFPGNKNRAMLLNYLHDNPDELEEVSQLGEYKLAAKLSEIKTELNKPKSKPSTAPKPLNPPKPASSSSSGLPSDDDPVDVWLAKERKREWAKRNMSG